jgi:hypothetical protein
MPLSGATADENHGAQTTPSAVCGFSSPNCPKAADLPVMRRSALHDPIFIGVPNTAEVRGVK